MMKNNDVDPRLISLLDELKTASPRDPHAAARGRARFLTEAVSARDKPRHSLWTIFLQKEQLTMNFIVSTLVIIGLLFGGSATVAAAQDDLPNQPLYQLKLISEEVKLGLISDPVRRIETLMQQSQNRIQEMEVLTTQGVTPPSEAATRVQEKIQQALHITAQLDEASQLSILQQIQTRLQTQEQQILQLQRGSCTVCAPALQQTREMLQIQLREVESGIAMPAGMQNQNQNQMQNQNQAQTTSTPQSSDQVIPVLGTCTPVLDGSGNPSGGTAIQQNNSSSQGGDGTQNGSGSGGGNNPSPGFGGQGGKP